MPQPVTMLVSSRTGNTQKIADAIRAELERLGWEVRDRERGQGIDTSLVIICFWCFKSRFDPLNAKLLDQMAGKRVLVFGIRRLPGQPVRRQGARERDRRRQRAQ